MKEDETFNHRGQQNTVFQPDVKFPFELPWLEFGGTAIRCCICCEERDEEEEDEVAFAALDRGQPSVPGAERGRELVAQ